MKQYVVQFKWDDGDMETCMKTANELIHIIDMDDCYPEYEMAVYESTEIGSLTRLDMHGCWHDLDDPLYIKATRPDGSIAFAGYGTDH